MTEESSLEYRQRVMDKVSPSFCAAKWYNATIWLDWGQTTSCHHPDSHDIIIGDIAKNPAALHNTIEKKVARKQMLEGQKPPGCEYCWTIEDMGPQSISDRVFKTNIYDEESLNEIANSDPNSDIDLKTLEISFSRDCNFACCYCGPNFSTRWSKDIKKDGAYLGLEDMHGTNYGSDYDHQFPYEDKDINPYIAAFWRWWPRLSKSLQELRVTGGEPLLSQDFWELLRFIKNENRTNMDFAVNTNLGLNDHRIDKLIDYSHQIQNFHIYTSCETTGEQAEYIRDGLNFKNFITNIEKLSEKGNFKSINIMMTINALCLFNLCDFLDLIMDWKKKYRANCPTFTMNMLRFPSFMSALTLPDNLKEDAKQSLIKWYAENKKSDLLLTHERDSIERLVDYLHRVQKPHEKASDRQTCETDFKKFFTQYDQRRKKSITKLFPQNFNTWYQNIEVEQN